MNRLKNLLIIGAIAVALIPFSATAAPAPIDYSAQARDFVEKAESLTKSGQHGAAASAWINAAACLKMTGDLSLAIHCLDNAEPLIPHGASTELQLEFLAGKGSVLAQGKRPSDALNVLEEAASRAREFQNHSLLAGILNDLGVAHSALTRFGKAAEFFGAAQVAAAEQNHFDLQISARQNHLIASFQEWNRLHKAHVRLQDLHGWIAPEQVSALHSAHTSLLTSLDATESLTRSPQSLHHPGALFAAITAGNVAYRTGQIERSFRILRSAMSDTRRIKHSSLERAAMLGLGELYLNAGRGEEVTRLTNYLRSLRTDPDLHQQVSVELMSARALAMVQPNSADTEQTLLRSIAAVEKVRSDLARTETISNLGTSFRDGAGRPYQLLASHYLSQARVSPSGARRKLREQARAAIENFKAWELDDFYRDDCVNLALSGRQDISKIDQPDVAVLYVIPLDDRIEILLGTATGLESRSHPMPRRQLHALAGRFRFHLESDYGTSRFIEEATALFEALITPVADLLVASKPKHLVFVPDGALGNVPLSALYDAKNDRYLIEDFSISIAPSLSLIASDAQLEDSESKVALLAGLSDSVAGFPALPGAEVELSALRSIYRSPFFYLNNGFTQKSLADGILNTPASIIHIASHAEFNAASRGTFLLAHDRKISLDDLEGIIRPRKYRGTTVDLLCLSACQTAAGDDRAALGLAGAAVKSGARSVVASLWSIDDAATISIMTDFHRNFSRPSQQMEKGDALRKAQLTALQKDPALHPHFWAPFILIGDWR